jgi:hypothetical protein
MKKVKIDHSKKDFTEALGVSDEEYNRIGESFNEFIEPGISRSQVAEKVIDRLIGEGEYNERDAQMFITGFIAQSLSKPRNPILSGNPLKDLAGFLESLQEEHECVGPECNQCGKFGGKSTLIPVAKSGTC